MGKSGIKIWEGGFYEKIPLLFIILLFSTLLSSCFKDPIQDDLLNYVNNEIPKIAELETKVVEGWSSVSGDNYTDDKTMYNALNDSILENSNNLINEAEKVIPKTKEVTDLHALYISAIKEQHDAFLLIFTTIEEQDANKIATANDKLANAGKTMESYTTGFTELAKKHNVVVKAK